MRSDTVLMQDLDSSHSEVAPSRTAMMTTTSTTLWSDGVCECVCTVANERNVEEKKSVFWVRVCRRIQFSYVLFISLLICFIFIPPSLTVQIHFFVYASLSLC